MKKILLLLFVCFTSLDGHSQLVWEKCFGGDSEDRLNNSGVGHSNVIKTFDGNFVIAGNSYSSNGDLTGNHGARDYWIIKFDGSGNLLWQKNYGGSDNDQANKVIETTDHGYLVVGDTFSADGDVTQYKGGTDVWVLKLDSDGSIQWKKTYGGTGFDVGTSACQDGNFYVITGVTTSNDMDVSGNHSAPYTDVWTFKIDLTGNLIWQKCLGGSNYDSSVDIIKTPENDYVVCGTTSSTNGDVQSNTHSINSQTETWIIKLDSSGNKLFEKCYGGTSQEYGCGLINDTDGNYVILSTSASIDGDVTGHHGNTSDQDYWVTKINKINGSIIWQKSLGGSSEEKAGDIALASNGDYLINGLSYSSDGDITALNSGGIDYWFVRLTPSATVAWEYTLGTWRDEWGISIVESNPGCYIVTGNGSGKFITGHGGFDYWTAKVCDPALNVATVDIAESGFTVFPNPMVDFTTVKFNRQVNNYKIDIYDIYGHNLQSLQGISGYETRIDKGQMSSGFYFFKITDDDNNVIAIRKITID